MFTRYISTMKELIAEKKAMIFDTFEYRFDVPSLREGGLFMK